MPRNNPKYRTLCSNGFGLSCSLWTTATDYSGIEASVSPSPQLKFHFTFPRTQAKTGNLVEFTVNPDAKLKLTRS